MLRFKQVKLYFCTDIGIVSENAAIMIHRFDVF